MAFNAPSAITSCFYTTVRNVASGKRYHGWIPPHGKRLDAGEEISFFGDIGDYLARHTYHARHRRGFEEALKAGELVVVKNPALHLYDDTRDETKIIKLDDGAFSATDSCFGAYTSGN